MPCPMPHWRQGLLWCHHPPQPCSPTHQQWKHTHGTRDGKLSGHWSGCGEMRLGFTQALAFFTGYNGSYISLGSDIFYTYTPYRQVASIYCICMYSTLLHALLVGYQAHILDVSHYTIQSLQQLPLHALHHCWLEEGAQVHILCLLEHTEHPSLLLLKADPPVCTCMTRKAVMVIFIRSLTAMNKLMHNYTRYSVTVTKDLLHSTLQYVVQYNCTLEVLTYIPVQDKHRSWITLFAAALPHSPHSAGFHWVTVAMSCATWWEEEGRMNRGRDVAERGREGKV